jgi:hypothetical protein
MTTSRKRFAAPQRLLHWLMAVCILAMLFIGVGMVSTVTSKYLTLVQIHKPLGIAILVLALIRLTLRLCLRLTCAACRSAGADKAGRGSVAVCFLRADDRHAVDRLGNVIGGVLPGSAVRRRASAIDPASEPQPAYAAVACAFLPGLCLFRADPAARLSDSLP